MEWEKPEFDEIALACEVSGYANAQMNDEPRREKPESGPVNE